MCVCQTFIYIYINVNIKWGRQILNVAILQEITEYGQAPHCVAYLNVHDTREWRWIWWWWNINISKRTFTLVRQAREYCVCQTNAYENRVDSGGHETEASLDFKKYLEGLILLWRSMRTTTSAKLIYVITELLTTSMMQ